MIIWSEKELKFIKKHLEGSVESLAKFKEIGETGFCSEDTIELMHTVLENFDCANSLEHINKILYEVLDYEFANYLIRGFTVEELRELDWIEEQDCEIYKKIYELE